MRGERGIIVLVWAVVLCGLVLGQEPPAAEDEGAAAPAQQEPVREVDAGREVKMAEFLMRGGIVRGKIIYEDDDIIKIQRLGAGEIGYDKALIEELRRYTLSRSEYNEILGDHYADKTWDFEDDETEFLLARRAYQRALAGALDEKARDRLQKKLENILAERNEWQEEAIRRLQLQKVEDEAEAARLQKELTKKNLEAADKFGELAEKLQERVGRLESNSDLLARKIRDIGRVVSDMRRDIERLEDEVRRPTVVIYSLRRSFDTLVSRVDALERRVNRPSAP